jgi:hypothetical protein
MAKLLGAIDDPVFSWYPKWIELDESIQPKNWIKGGMSQPPTIKIQWSTPNGCGCLAMSPQIKGFSVPSMRYPTPYQTLK